MKNKVLSIIVVFLLFYWDFSRAKLNRGKGFVRNVSLLEPGGFHIQHSSNWWVPSDETLVHQIKVSNLKNNEELEWFHFCSIQHVDTYLCLRVELTWALWSHSSPQITSHSLRLFLGSRYQRLKSLEFYTFLQKNAVRYSVSQSSGSSGPGEKLVGKPLLAFPWWSWKEWLSHDLVSLPWVGLTFAILTLMLCKAELLQAWIWKKKNLAVKKMEEDV